MRIGSQKMDQLIVGLLEFSRIGRQALKREAIDSTALCKSAVEEVMTAHTGPKPNIEIGDLPRPLGDPVLLRQVWCNLIGNALKYTSKRAQPEIHVSGKVEGGEAVYEVKDNGAGFDMRYAAKLFGVFQRLHRAEEFSGTGVGLAIVQRIVVRHGGRISAQGMPDKGATFQFSLPRADS
jgi:light-regulated signal transduction histidine kinase (bacteriophytochrome)